jgi:hypothetical protein
VPNRSSAFPVSFFSVVFLCVFFAVFYLFVFFCFFVFFVFCFFSGDNEPGQPLLKRTDRDGGRAADVGARTDGGGGTQSGAGTAGVRDAQRRTWAAVAVRLTSLAGSSRQAGNADRTQTNRALSSRPAADTRTKERRKEKKIMAARVRRKQEKKHRDQQRK